MRGQDELGFDVDPFEKAFGQLAGPVHWPSLTETERLQAFADLREWVEQFVDRFAIEIRVIRLFRLNRATRVEGADVGRP